MRHRLFAVRTTVYILSFSHNFTQQTQAPANNYECSVEAVATMIGCLPTQALAFLVVFVYATHATQAIDAFEWKPGFSYRWLANIATHKATFQIAIIGPRLNCCHFCCWRRDVRQFANGPACVYKNVLLPKSVCLRYTCVIHRPKWSSQSTCAHMSTICRCRCRRHWWKAARNTDVGTHKSV